MSKITTYSLPDRSIQTTTIRPRCIRRERTCQYSRLMIKLGFHLALPHPALANVIEPYCLHNISVGSTKKKKKLRHEQYPMRIVRAGRVCWRITDGGNAIEKRRGHCCISITHSSTPLSTKKLEHEPKGAIAKIFGIGLFQPAVVWIARLCQQSIPADVAAIDWVPDSES
jgi:hypothetical protein